MEARPAKRLRRLVACGALALAALGAGAGQASATQAEYDTGYALGLEAYKYGLPVVTTDKTFRNQTSIDVPNGKGFGPVNRFNHARKLTDPNDKSVVAPNHDTLYSIAWLNLKHEPQVIHIPKIKNRYFVVPLMDPWTEDFRNLGSVNKTKPGDYVVTGPGQGNVDVPRGTHRIKTRYTRVWIIARILVKGEDDVKNVNKIQNRLTLTPLSKYGTDFHPRPPRDPDTTVNNPPLPSGLHFFDKLCDQLRRFPPPAADQAELDKLAEIGIGPGRKPSQNPNLSADTKQGMIDAVAAGPAMILDDVRAKYLAGFAAHNGYLIQDIGHYGTDYVLRAVVTQIGLGALVPKESIYPLAQVDKSLAPLTGAKRYVLHIPDGQLPPVNAFWSLTIYDLQGFFTPNPIDRYLVNDRTDLAYNADGSLDIYIQAQQPTDPMQAQNWLPAPADGFRVIWRLYGTKPDQINGILDGSGWDPPSITAVP